MPFTARTLYKRSFFAFIVALLAGCSTQQESLLPSANPASAIQSTTTRARMVSSTVRAGGKTYVIDQMYTPVSTTLGGITSGSDGNIWFTGHGVVGKSSVAGDMTDYAIPLPIGDDLASITEGPDHNFWMTSFPGAIDRITPAGQFDSFPIPKQFGGTSAGVFSIASGFGDLWTLDPHYYADYLLEITPQGKFHGYKLGPGSQGVSLTAAHDGSIWFTDYRKNAITHMTAPGN